MNTRACGYHPPSTTASVIAKLTAEQLEEAANRAAEAARSTLRFMPTDDILAVLDRVVLNWLDPNYHLRRLAEEVLPRTTGFSVEMVHHGLPQMVAPLRADEVRKLLNAELNDYRALDRVYGGRRVVSPSLITHVLSGNIPGLAATPIVLSMALKSAALVKPAAGDPIFPALFAASINEVNEQVGRSIVVAYWHGGDRALEDVAFARADLVVASGSDAAVSAIATRVRDRFIAYGHKISFAVVSKEELVDRESARRLARRLAYDVVLWDQQGCLSPQLCYLECGARIAANDFADLLTRALADYAFSLPPRTLSIEEQTEVLRFRQEAEWRAAAGAPVSLLASSDSSAWTVVTDDSSDFRPGCSHRCLRLSSLRSFSELPAVLAPHGRHLEAAGIAAGERSAELAEVLAACGVHRICPIGTMQQPTLAWRQGGRPRIADWVEWVGLEQVSGGEKPSATERGSDRWQEP